MKRVNSIKSLKSRGQVVSRRDGSGKRRLIIINKKNPKFKAKQ